MDTRGVGRFGAHGFSLLEVVISMSLLSALGIAVLNTNNSGMLAAKGVQDMSQLELATLEVSKHLANMDFCTCNVAGKTLTLGTPAGTAPPASHDMTLQNFSGGCTPTPQSVLTLGEGNSNAAGWDVQRIYLDQVSSIPSSSLISAKVKIQVSKKALPGGGTTLGAQTLYREIPISMIASDVSGGAATIQSCVSNLAIGSPLTSGAGTITGSMITGLRADTYYTVSVYGYTQNKGNGSATLLPVSVRGCGVGAAVLAATPSQVINWHDGNAPQSASFVIQPPPDGCVQGYADGWVSSMSYVAIANQAYAASNGGIQSLGSTVTSNTVNGLVANDSYLVQFYGVSLNHGTGGATFGSNTIRACGSAAPIASTPPQNVNSPDGNVPISATLTIVAPGSGCIEAFVDATQPAQTITVVKLN